MNPVCTACPYCGVGCGVLATRTAERTATIAGDPDHPANRGKLCSKGTHLGETIGLEGRLLYPMIGSKRADWDSAADLIATRFAAAVAEYGPDSVAFYASGQMLTEDYYVANKLMKGFIGTGNIDTNSRLCMASAVAAHTRAFGEDVVPCSYDDLDAADLIILVGSNTAWCHPVIWHRIEVARAMRGTKVVVIDPRRTETAAGADLHLAIAPDSDVALWNGLLAELRATWQLDGSHLASHVDVPADFWSSLDTANVAKVCDIAPDALQMFYTLFADRPRTVTLFSQGVNQSTSGTDKANAIINVHLATGRIGKPGTGPFSITGQPNAMGGREVGGLATMLAAHMGFSDPERDRVQRFWQSPTIAPRPGLKAVDLFEAMAAGTIKAVWIMATNPVVSMPDINMVRMALATCPFVVVSDCVEGTDTQRYAHVRLPALGWGEKDGTVTNSERRISRQRAFLTPPGEARPDWLAVAEIAQRMGFDGFAYPSAASIFREFAAQTGFENDGSRLLDIADKAAISDSDYAAMAPFQWGGPSPFAAGRYPTSDGRARLIAVRHVPRDDGGWTQPLRLNSGRYRDQWHTMTRTGLSPKLSQHRREPLVEIHPDTARRFGLTNGGLAWVETARGRSIFRVAETADQRRGEIFVPIHWSAQISTGGRAGALPGTARDPISGQPGFKNTPASIQPYIPEWQGFLVSRLRLPAPDCTYWTRIRSTHGWLIEIAGDGDAALLLPQLQLGERAEMIDPRGGVIRSAVIADGHLQSALFVSRGNGLPPRDWLMAQLGEPGVNANALLAGRPAVVQPYRGPVVCVCFDVHLKTITTAIVSQQLSNIEAVGAALRAGTNCGSCRPAIAGLLAKEFAHA